MKIIIFLAVFILMFSVSTVFANENITDDQLYVSQTVGSFNDIQNSINDAKNGDVIELDGYYDSNKNVININKQITIQSSNNTAILDGKKQSQIFKINADKVSLKNLIIKNSLDSAIDSSSDKKYTFTIINCTFINNGDGWDGGIIFNTNKGTLNIINSTFSNNNADFGGAIYSVGDGEINIINSNFNGNTADNGGSIYASFKKLTIINSYFTNNKNGAIYADGDLLEIIHSNFDNNNADNGGAIYADVNNIVISKSNFTKNTANNEGSAIYVSTDLDSSENLYNLGISDCQFNSNTKGYAIYANVYKVNIKNSIFKSNSNDLYLKIGTLSNVNNTMKVPKIVNTIKATLKSFKYSTYYDSWKLFAVSLKDVNGNSISECKVKITTGKGSKAKVFYGILDEDEHYIYFPLSKLPVGKHKITISLDSKYYKANPIKTTIIIKKAKTIVKAKKLIANYKKSKKFTVKIKNKETNYNVKNIKIKIKVFTGKKFKKFIVKTNKKGVASLDSKKIKKGYHKVIITSKNSNYDIFKQSVIIIK